MKNNKLVSLGIVILLCSLFVACSAQEVPTVPLSVQIGAPETVTEEIGNVKVDAKVYIPEVYSVDILEAIPSAYDDNEIRRFAESFMTDKELWYYADTGKLYEGFQLSQKEEKDGSVQYSYFVENPPLDSSPYRCIEAFYGLKKGKLSSQAKLIYLRKVYGLEISDPLPLTNGLAEGCSITPEEAEKLAREVVDKVGEDFLLCAAGQIRRSPMYNNPQYYLLRFSRTINGIPVNNATGMEKTESEEFIAGQDVITAVVSDNGVAYFEEANPTLTGKTVQKNAKLLSFDKIMETFRTYVNAGESIVQQEVYQIRLGYMAVYQGKGKYRYLPVWDFYSYGSSEGSPVYWSPFLTMNAVTGEPVDRRTGK